MNDKHLIRKARNTENQTKEYQTWNDLILPKMLNRANERVKFLYRHVWFSECKGTEALAGIYRLQKMVPKEILILYHWLLDGIWNYTNRLIATHSTLFPTLLHLQLPLVRSQETFAWPYSLLLPDLYPCHDPPQPWMLSLCLLYHKHTLPVKVLQ